MDRIAHARPRLNLGRALHLIMFSSQRKHRGGVEKPSGQDRTRTYGLRDVNAAL